MRTKAIPAPPGADATDAATASTRSPTDEEPTRNASTARRKVNTVLSAVPRVPRDEADCCRRLCDRVEWIDRRPVASRWLAFLRALDHVEVTSHGYARRTDALDVDLAAARFVDRVVLAADVLDELDERPTTSEAAFEAVESAVPEWERRRSADWRTDWRRRVRHLLEWAVLLDLADRQDDGYVARADDSVRR